MASVWGKAWGKAWGNAWGPTEATPPAVEPKTDAYQAIANNIYNRRVDGPANHVFMRIGARHPRRK